MQTWIIVHLHTMPFSAGAALRTIRSATNGASIDEPKGLRSWQARGIRAPARGHSCRLAEAAASCSCCSSELCGPIADVAINEDGLPTPTDTLASQVVGRCKHGSLSICTQCHSVQARRLEPSDLRRTAALMRPKVCAAGKHEESVPQPEDIPVALQRLRPRVLAALRLVDVDAGVYQRAPHGYRVHTAMIRFSWASTSVDNQIQALPNKKDRRRATKALGHLLTCTDSAYHTFYDLHPDFLRRHRANVQEKMKKLPLSFLETPGIECAVWPQLYRHRNLCETVTRANHENRRKRRRAAWQQQTGDSTSSNNASSHEPEEADCGEAPTDPRMNSQVKDNNFRTNAASFNGPCHLPVARIGASFSNGTMMALEHQPPPASIHSPSSCLERSLCRICTLLQPEEGWGYSDPFSEPVNWHVS